MAFGAEVIFATGLGFVVLGPKRMHALLGQVARARAELQWFQKSFASQLEGSVENTIRPSADEQVGTTDAPADSSEPAAP